MGQMTKNRSEPARGFCLYKTGKCLNERSLKKNLKAHTLCEFHRTRQNKHQRKLNEKYQHLKLTNNKRKRNSCSTTTTVPTTNNFIFPRQMDTGSSPCSSSCSSSSSNYEGYYNNSNSSSFLPMETSIPSPIPIFINNNPQDDEPAYFGREFLDVINDSYLDMIQDEDHPHFHPLTTKDDQLVRKF